MAERTVSNKTPKAIRLLLIFLILAVPIAAVAQKGTVTRITVHGKSLENTVTKENPDREVSIYLPPDYKTNKKKRYPVVYLLHGIGDTDQTWTAGWNKPAQVGINRTARGRFRLLRFLNIWMKGYGEKSLGK
jgi:poly(3-hydroxybutyrate) depolymerase